MGFEASTVGPPLIAMMRKASKQSSAISTLKELRNREEIIRENSGRPIALDAGREVQFIEQFRQAADHPVIASYPEGLYLKGFACRVM